MKQYIPVLRKTKMFSGVGDEEIESMLSCLNARVQHYKKGEYVLRAGGHLRDILILVEGSLHIQKDDYWGNRSLLGQLGAGEMFGEAYVAPESGALMNDVVAVEDSAVMFFDLQRLLATCSSACRFHAVVVQICFSPFPKRTESLCKNSGICRSVRLAKS